MLNVRFWLLTDIPTPSDLRLLYPQKPVSLDCHLTNGLDEQTYPNHANKKGNSKDDITSTTLFVPLVLLA